MRFAPARVVRWQLCVSAVSLFTWGCVSEPADARTRLVALEAEGESVLHAIDTLEQRMIAQRGVVRTWRELAERHHLVSQVACQNQATHLEQMVARLGRAEEPSSVLAQASRGSTAAGSR